MEITWLTKNQMGQLRYGDCRKNREKTECSSHMVIPPIRLKAITAHTCAKASKRRKLDRCPERAGCKVQRLGSRASVPAEFV